MTNWLKQILNKPIGGRLGKRKSSRFAIILFLLGFLGLLEALAVMLGVKQGLLFTIGFSVFALVLLFQAHHRCEKR
jgi:hypothetical protein